MGRVVNGMRLGELRGKKGWGQKELAGKVGVNIRTISRWEKGNRDRNGRERPLRAASLHRLSEALGVESDVLCSEGPLPSEYQSKHIGDRSQITIRMDNACRNALVLVARRYGVQQQHIIDLAPLLFMQAAEVSLSQRREKMEEVYNNLDYLQSVIELERHDNIPYYDELLGNIEETSINNSDLFSKGRWDQMEDPEFENPFVLYIRGLVMGCDFEFCWDGGSSPSYKLWKEKIRQQIEEIVGNKESAKEAILNGHVILSEMPEDIRKSSICDRVKWVEKSNEERGKKQQKILSNLLCDYLNDD